MRLGIAGIGVAAHAFDIVEAEVRAPGGEEEGRWRDGALRGRHVPVGPTGRQSDMSGSETPGAEPQMVPRRECKPDSPYKGKEKQCGMLPLTSVRRGTRRPCSKAHSAAARGWPSPRRGVRASTAPSRERQSRALRSGGRSVQKGGKRGQSSV